MNMCNLNHPNEGRIINSEGPMFYNHLYQFIVNTYYLLKSSAELQ